MGSNGQSSGRGRGSAESETENAARNASAASRDRGLREQAEISAGNMSGYQIGAGVRHAGELREGRTYIIKYRGEDVVATYTGGQMGNGFGQRSFSAQIGGRTRTIILDNDEINPRSVRVAVRGV